MVQGHAAGGYAPPGISGDHGGTAGEIPALVACAGFEASRPFEPAAAPAGAAVGAIRGDRRAAGAGLSERLRIVSGARFGSRARDRHTGGAGRVARAAGTAVTDREPRDCVGGRTARDSGGSGCRASADRSAPGEWERDKQPKRWDGFARKPGFTAAAVCLCRQRGGGRFEWNGSGMAGRTAVACVVAA